MKNYLPLNGETENTIPFVFVDCDNDLHEIIFAKRGLTVYVFDELVRTDCIYRIVFCDVDRKDVVTFCKAMEELAVEVERYGYVDYYEFTARFVYGVNQYGSRVNMTLNRLND